MKLGEGNNIFPIKPTFIFINFISFIIYDKRASINRIFPFCRIRTSNSNNYSNYFSNYWIHPNKERKMITILINIRKYGNKSMQSMRKRITFIRI